MPLFDPETGKLLEPGSLKTIQFGNVYHGEYSPSTGTYVSSVRDLKDQNAKKADEMSARMGYDISYGLADPADTKHLGVTPDE